MSISLTLLIAPKSDLALYIDFPP